MITNRLRFVETKENERTVCRRKQDLRAYMKERRGENENRDVKETLLMENFFEALKSFSMEAGTQRSCFVYLSFSSEAPTDRLVEILKESGVKLYAPKIKDKEMYAVSLEEDFEISPWGIREPIGEIYTQAPDIAIVPLLAADEQGNRLGYGGGYYDRYLGKNVKTLRIGYAFDFQILKEVPCEPWDEKLDVIITDKRIIYTHVRDEWKWT